MLPSLVSVIKWIFRRNADTSDAADSLIHITQLPNAKITIPKFSHLFFFVIIFAKHINLILAFSLSRSNSDAVQPTWDRVCSHQNHIACIFALPVSKFGVSFLSQTTTAHTHAHTHTLPPHTSEDRWNELPKYKSQAATRTEPKKKKTKKKRKKKKHKLFVSVDVAFARSERE